MRRLITILVVSALLSGCGGGSSSPPQVPSGASGNSATQRADMTVLVQVPAAPQSQRSPLNVTVHLEDPETLDEVVSPVTVPATYGQTVLVDFPGVPAGQLVIARAVVDREDGTEVLSDSEEVARAPGATVKLTPSTPPVNEKGVWTSSGPSPVFDYFNVIRANCTGRIASLLVDPLDPRRIFVGSASGGVWLTTDGGNAWSCLTPRMECNAIGAMCFDPSDATRSTVYVGTGEAVRSGLYGAGIFKVRTDGTITKLPGSEVFARKAISALDVRPDGTVVVGVYLLGSFGIQSDGGYGVYVRRPGSSDFVNTFAATLPVSDVKIRPGARPGDKDIWYAGVDTWTGPGTRQGGVYRSPDAGQTWTRLAMNGADGLPVVDISQIGRVTLAIAPSRPDVIYALLGSTGDPFLGVYVSADRGDTWAQVSTDPEIPDLLAYESGASSSAQSTYNQALVVDPRDPAAFYAAGTRPLRVSGVDFKTGKGTSVSLASSDGFQQDANHPHVDHHAMVAIREGQTTSVFDGCDGGLWKLPDAATSTASSPFSNLNGRQSFLETLQLYSVSVDPADSTILFGGMQDNGSAGTVGNRLWTAVRGGDGGMTVYDAKQSVAYVTAQYSRNRLYRLSRVTHEKGAFKSRQSRSTGLLTGEPGLFIPPLTIGSDSRIALGTVRVYESKNGGDDWTDISGPLSRSTISAMAYKPDDPSVLYVGQSNGGIWRTRDPQRGTAFENLYRTSIPAGQPISAIAVDPADKRGDTAYIAQGTFSATGQVLRTTNGGKSWEVFSDGLPDAPVLSLALCSQVSPSLLFAGNDSGVWYVALDGESTTWKRFGAMPSVMVRSLQLSRKKGNDTVFLVAGTFGRGVLQIPVTAEAKAQVPPQQPPEQSDSDSNDDEDKSPRHGGEPPQPPAGF